MSENKELLYSGTYVFVNKEHRFGTDAMLLSHFCRVRRAEKVADLGTGCGIMPLRFFDMGHRGECLAVDISGEAIKLLEKSIAQNGCCNIKPLCKDLKSLPYDARYDVVSCNPPYFTGGYKSDNDERRTARFEEACTIMDVCDTAARLLKDGGRLCICQRPMRLADVIHAMKSAGIEPKLLRMVRQRRSSSEPWLVLVQGQKNRAPGIRIMQDLLIEDESGNKSAELIKIYQGGALR